MFWENICRRYERHEIGLYQLEEMKEVICPHLATLTSLRKIIDSSQPKFKGKGKRKHITA